MSWAIITLNKQSIKTAKKLKASYNNTKEIDIYTIDKYLEEGLLNITGGLKAYNKNLFENYKVIIYIMALGIVVREISPYLKHKSIDPAVLCLSIDGRYAIPVLSGHLGGANEISIEISDRLKGTPVITTATDILNKTAVDMIAKNYNLVITSFESAKEVTGLIINDEVVEIISEVPINIKSVDKTSLNDININTKGIIYISYKTNTILSIPFAQLIPKRLVLGLGVKRGISHEQINKFVKAIMNKHSLDIRSVSKIASIDLKKDEKGIITLSESLNVPFIVYKASQLNEVVDKFEQSEFVKQITGVGAVSMPSGYLASNKGICIVKKVIENGMTLSIWEEII